LSVDNYAITSDLPGSSPLPIAVHLTAVELIASNLPTFNFGDVAGGTR
jgi:hypothetical protein